MPPSSIERYRRSELGDPQPEDATWVRLGDRVWALGRLARNSFGGDLQLQPLKVDLAVYQTLAVVGAIAQRRDLPKTLEIDLGVLLPYGEYQDRDRLCDNLTAALAQFAFRDREYTCHLDSFHALPEGGGLFARGLPENVLEAAARDSILISNTGFRNSSRLAVEQGVLRGETDDFGFSYVLRRVQQSTSGQRFDDARLMAAASQPTPERRGTALAKHLARSQDDESRAYEGKTLARAVEAARQEYFMNLGRRLRAFSLNRPKAIVLGGGTSWYCRDDLRAILRQHYPSQQTRLEFCTELRQRCERTLGDQLKQRGISAHRAIDCYGFFLKLLQTEFLQEAVAGR